MHAAIAGCGANGSRDIDYIDSMADEMDSNFQSRVHTATCAHHDSSMDSQSRVLDQVEKVVHERDSNDLQYRVGY
jgi:hypothetical protein